MSEYPQLPWRSDKLPALRGDDGQAGDCQANIASLPSKVEASWRFALMVEIGNFVSLRRLLGLADTRALMTEIATRLEQLVPAAIVSLIGRDLIELRFTGRRREQLDAVAANVSAAFDASIVRNHHAPMPDIILGGARCDGAEHDDVRLVEEAERALREARVNRAPVLRDVVQGGGAIDRIALARDLAQAIDGDELFLQYQPKLNLRRQEVSGVEALVRWQHPIRGLVMPGDFISVAEESRDIVALSLWTLRRAIGDQRLLAEAGHDLIVFVNISAVLLGDARFVHEACVLVSEGSARIGFEITETAVIHDPDGAIANLKIFADIGVTLAIDDYGSGLSSLAYLKKLPARELKIDKLFVTQLTSSNRDPLIVRSTIDLAHALEMEVVAEGVETHAAMALLSVMGCDMAQGFLISRPIGLDALLVFLETQPHRGLIQDMSFPFKRLQVAGKHG